jgi:hypothetical protein
MPRLVPPVLEAGTFADIPQPVLDAGDDLSLRPWIAADAAVLAAAYDDVDIRHWHHRSMTVEEAADWIADGPERWVSETGAEWAVAAVARWWGGSGCRSAARWDSPRSPTGRCRTHEAPASPPARS